MHRSVDDTCHVLYIPDLTLLPLLDNTGHTLDYNNGAWPQQKFTLPWHLFSHSGFTQCLCFLFYRSSCMTLTHGCVIFNGRRPQYNISKHNKMGK